MYAHSTRIVVITITSRRILHTTIQADNFNSRQPAGPYGAPFNNLTCIPHCRPLWAWGQKGGGDAGSPLGG
jgi:hypothetical protein